MDVRPAKAGMFSGRQSGEGGDGANDFDLIGAIEQWVEKGKPPDQIIASHRTDGKVDCARPLCPYPKVAKYKGTGSTDDAANFSCSVLE
jgi:feruloyl esterase